MQERLQKDIDALKKLLKTLEKTPIIAEFKNEDEYYSANIYGFPFTREFAEQTANMFEHEITTGNNHYNIDMHSRFYKNGNYHIHLDLDIYAPDVNYKDTLNIINTNWEEKTQSQKTAKITLIETLTSELKNHKFEKKQKMTPMKKVEWGFVRELETIPRRERRGSFRYRPTMTKRFVNYLQNVGNLTGLDFEFHAERPTEFGIAKYGKSTLTDGIELTVKDAWGYHRVWLEFENVELFAKHGKTLLEMAEIPHVRATGHASQKNGYKNLEYYANLAKEVSEKHIKTAKESKAFKKKLEERLNEERETHEKYHKDNPKHELEKELKTSEEILESNTDYYIKTGSGITNATYHIDGSEPFIKAIKHFIKRAGLEQELKYKQKLRNLDQELPITIEEIREAQKKISALKALEREVLKNPTRETIKLAQICGANTEEATKKHNQRLEEKIKRYRKKIKKTQKEKL